MHRSYRMRYGEEPIVDGYTPIRIIVKMMNGKDHTLFTEHDNETFLNVKTALLHHISPMSVLRQLVFQYGNNEIGYENVDDNEHNHDDQHYDQHESHLSYTKQNQCNSQSPQNASTAAHILHLSCSMLLLRPRPTGGGVGS